MPHPGPEGDRWCVGLGCRLPQLPSLPSHSPSLCLESGEGTTAVCTLQCVCPQVLVITLQDSGMSWAMRLFQVTFGYQHFFFIIIWEGKGDVLKAHAETDL